MHTKSKQLVGALTLLALSGCVVSEANIDRSCISGTVSLVPAVHAETEAAQGDNDTAELAEDLGFVGNRVVQVSGTTLEFSAVKDGPANGDLDAYRFAALASGTLTVSLEWDETSDPGDTATEPERETTIYHLSVVDLDNLNANGAPTTLYDSPTTNGYGLWEASFDVVEGGNYAVSIGGRSGDEAENPGYAFSIDGFDPNDSQYLVGAYLRNSFASHGDPVGGAEVRGFKFDSATQSWVGKYTMKWLRLVETCDPDQGKCPETGGTTANENASGDVFLFASNAANLNAGVTSKLHFTSESTTVALKGDEWITDIAVAVDTIQPITIGTIYTEEEPNGWVQVDGSLDLEAIDPGGQDLGELSSIGVVDLIQGSIEFGEEVGYGAHDDDLFRFTVPADTNIAVTVAWDTGDDMDYYVFASVEEEPVLQLDTADDWFANPEFGVTESPLMAGTTHFLWIAGYEGTAGSVANYTMSVEYLAP